MKQIIYKFYTPKEKTPPTDKMLLLNCKSGTWVGTFDGKMFWDEDAWIVVKADIVSWAKLQIPA